jgi:signal transduction histidine kinase
MRPLTQRAERIRDLALGVGALAAAIFAIAAIVWVNLDHMQREWNTDNATREELAWADSAADAVSDQENAIQGLQSTHDPRFVPPYEVGRGRLDTALTALTSLAADDRAQNRRDVADARKQLAIWTVSYAEPLVAAVRSGRAMPPTSIDRDKVADAIDSDLQNVRHDQSWALHARDRSLAAAFGQSRAALLVGSVLASVFAATIIGRSAWQLMRERRRAEQAASELRDALSRAEDGSRAKTAFLANMSHEIRTPLNGVLGMAQVMAMGQLDTAQRERLDVIQSSGEALLAVLNDVLDLSKIEAGRIEFESAPFDVGEIAADVQAAFAVRAGADVAFSIEIAPDAAGRWSGDAVRVRQILYNLVSNALKFTREGEVRARVARAAARCGEGLSLTVSDTGIGIAPEILPKLFDKFVQADSTITRRFGGAGLGLAISRQLAQLMGGEITVESTPGEGSVFTVFLPMPWVGPAAPQRAAPALGAHWARETPRLDRLSLLAAEDNQTNQLVLKTLLGAFGVAPTIVSDGAQAVEAWSKGGFDLVLMDIQMPVMDGVAATREIRRRECAHGLGHTPIVALSANAMKHQVEEYLAAGMDSHLAKPIQIDRLYETLLAAASHPMAARKEVA